MHKGRTWASKGTRRQVLQGLAATSLLVPQLARPAFAAAPAASKVTPELIEAAKKEGKAIWYSAVDLPVVERIAKAFEAKYPGIAVRVERSGGERIFQRIGQELASNIHAVDVVKARMRRTSSSGSATASWRPMCRRMWPITIRPSTRIPTGSSRAGACGCR